MIRVRSKTGDIVPNFLYDIGEMLIIDNKKYIVRAAKEAYTTRVRCKYCPFNKTRCSFLAEALGLPKGISCMNIITLSGRLEPYISGGLKAWREYYELKNR